VLVSAGFSYGQCLELGYARVSTVERDLQRQVEALTAAGVGVDRIFVDTKVGVSVDRPGWRAVRELAGPGDVVVVHTLDRLGRTTRDTLGVVQELTGRGVGVRSLADPVSVDSADPAAPVGQLMVAVLVLLAQMERTYTAERAAHARAVASRLGNQVGRPSLLDPARLALAVQLRERGHTMAQIVAKTGMTRSSLYRYLPPRPPAPLTAAEPRRRSARIVTAVLLVAVAAGCGSPPRRGDAACGVYPVVLQQEQPLTRGEEVTLSSRGYRCSHGTVSGIESIYFPDVATPSGFALLGSTRVASDGSFQLSVRIPRRATAAGKQFLFIGGPNYNRCGRNAMCPRYGIDVSVR
jgi:DNA invertase Pin-like site-specific DNA recombinase